jgi:6-phosphogluconolactonase
VASTSVLQDPASLALAAAQAFVRAAADAISATGRFAVALSGGSTPAPLYSLLAAAPFRSKVDWPRVHVFFSDERCVPPDDPASNYGLAHGALLAHVPIPPAQVHRIPGEDPPASAAAASEAALRAAFATPSGPPRTAPGSRFDLVLLGLGADGHTASLFPGSPALHESSRWAAAVSGPGPSATGSTLRRVTLTPLLLNAAAEVLFLVTGASKAATVARVLEGPRDPTSLPAQSIVPASGRVRWLLDAPAAALLVTSGRG